MSEQRAFEYRHVVGFEETNLVGNVYYVNHLRWQGRCRELFLREHAPELLDQLRGELCLVTLSCSCRYLDELNAFDEVLVRMRLKAQVQHRIALEFEYRRLRDGVAAPMAYGEQEIGCMRRTPDGLVPTSVPETLAAALRLYSA
jgi:enediyne biosynthesis thioesterase